MPVELRFLTRILETIYLQADLLFVKDQPFIVL